MIQLKTHEPPKATPGELCVLTIPRWEFGRPRFSVFDTHGKQTGMFWEYQEPTVCLVLKQLPTVTKVLLNENIIHINYGTIEAAFEGYDVYLVPINAVADKHTK